jgi:eukaryotic-like serine/threonine-protein kinase
MELDPVPSPELSSRDWLARLVRGAPDTGTLGAGKALATVEGLSAFRSEEGTAGQESVAPPPDGVRAGDSPARRSPSRPVQKRVVWSLLAAIGAMLAAGSLVVLLSVPARSKPLQPMEARPARVTLDTRPSGAEVLLHEEVRGRTPLTLTLKPGHHIITIRRGSEQRNLPLDIAEGAEVMQYLEFPVAATKLSVITEPPGARVTIDGESRGVSPITVGDLTAARHTVTVAGASGPMERTVTTEAGTTMSIVFSLPRAPSLEVGWLAIAAPFEVTVLERTDVVGTSASSKIMIPAGRHELDLVNESLGYRDHRGVEIGSGKTASIRVDARAPLSVNARPWADVVIDGTPAGQTPIANVLLPLGTHQVVFRHPELGERRQSVVVTARGPNRVAVDLVR